MPRDVKQINSEPNANKQVCNIFVNKKRSGTAWKYYTRRKINLEPLGERKKEKELALDSKIGFSNVPAGKLHPNNINKVTKILRLWNTNK